MTDRLGPYKIVRTCIARGGSGCVHEAVASDGSRVALKVLDRAAIESRAKAMLSDNSGGSKPARKIKLSTDRLFNAYKKRFRDEFHILAGLSHENIASVRGAFLHKDTIFIAYDYIDGKPIAEFVRGWNPKEMIPLFVQALRGLDYVHNSGVIHLDIKSANILVDGSSGAPRVKIIDFGLATSAKVRRVGFAGSPSSMAPEVALGQHDEVDRRADLFSFGVVMYHCATWGQMPFARPIGCGIETIQRVIRDEANRKPYPISYAHYHKKGFVPEKLESIVMRLISHHPTERYYKNAGGIINALSIF